MKCTFDEHIDIIFIYANIYFFPEHLGRSLFFECLHPFSRSKVSHLLGCDQTRAYAISSGQAIFKRTNRIIHRTEMYYEKITFAQAKLFTQRLH